MIIKFDGEYGKKRFEFCFVGFVLGGSLNDKKGINILRLEAGLFEKLESISVLKPCGKKMLNGEPERQLEGEAEVEITPSELNLLHNYISQVPWQTGSPSRNAVIVLDWLESQSLESQSQENG